MMMMITCLDLSYSDELTGSSRETTSQNSVSCFLNVNLLVSLLLWQQPEHLVDIWGGQSVMTVAVSCSCSDILCMRLRCVVGTCRWVSSLYYTAEGWWSRSLLPSFPPSFPPVSLLHTCCLFPPLVLFCAAAFPSGCMYFSSGRVLMKAQWSEPPPGSRLSLPASVPALHFASSHRCKACTPNCGAHRYVR